jgi:plastocyanin
MRTSTRDRLVLPILLPIVMLLVIGAVLFGFSRILLSLTSDAATGIAIIVALSILVVASVVSSRSVIRTSSLASMLGAIAGVAMLAGGIALISVGAGGEKEGGGPAVTIALTAKDIAFDQTKLSVPAGSPFAIAFDNQDAGIQHDVEIFDNEKFTGTPLMNGEIVTGPAKVTYQAPALEPGTYYFHCSVHPAQMQGTIQTTAGGPGGGAATGTVAAQDLQFDTDRIELPGGAPSTIHFENNDPGIQHNIAIFTDSSLGTELFRGEIVTGPATVDYRIPPLEPGTYYFHCDVHPTMSGTVVVRAGGGGGPPPPSVTPGGGGSPPPTATPGGGGGGTANPSTVTAQGVAFSTTEIGLPAGSPSTIHFENKDAGISHNIAIYTDSSLGTNLFRGQIITGPASIDYSIPALEGGTYYFHCDVHPTMKGSVTVG